MRGAGRRQGRILCLPEPSQVIEAIAREALEPFVEDIFYASNRRYGSRRIVVRLRKVGIVANGKTVQRMMTRKGRVSCRAPKKYGRGGKASDKGTNVLSREFSVQKRNGVWRGNITRIPTREGWPCLATRLDLFSRKIVGWQAPPASTRIWQSTPYTTP